jgi:hypothetical protein
MIGRIPLTLLPRELQQHLTGNSVPGYRALYNAALNGCIPAVRGENGRWTVAQDDLPAIAAAMVSIRHAGPTT